MSGRLVEDPILRCQPLNGVHYEESGYMHGRPGFANYHLALIVVVFHIRQEVGAETQSLFITTRVFQRIGSI